MRPRWRAALRLLFQSVALVLTIFLAQQPAALPVPPPDVDHVEPFSHGGSGQTATRHRASSRAAQSPVVKRLSALPTFVLGALFSRSQTLARTEARHSEGDSTSPFRIQRRIPRMDSDEPPRG